MALPPPIDGGQAYYDVSALEAGTIGLPLNEIIDAPAGVVLTAPSLSFLLQYRSANEDNADENTIRTPKNLLFDLGIRKDWRNLPPNAIAADDEDWDITMDLNVSQDVVESLAKGGLTPDDIEIVCLSHCHFDHVGDPKLFPKSTFIVGGQAKELFDKPGYPDDPHAKIASDLLPSGRTKFLSANSIKDGDEDGDTEWAPIGPFPQALDLYKDGSLYIVDAPGHYQGHINILARTSDDGGWIFLAGDSAHHWSIVNGENEIATKNGCAHVNKEAAEVHLTRIRKLVKENGGRVRVLLAHDEPWYKGNKDDGKSAFWPGRISSL